jgi:hypothetical protein
MTAPRGSSLDGFGASPTARRCRARRRESSSRAGRDEGPRREEIAVADVPLRSLGENLGRWRSCVASGGRLARAHDPRDTA